MEFIGSYLDYTKDELKYSSKVHTDLESVKCDLNFVISCIIQERFGVFLTDEYLFIQNPLNVKINIVQTVRSQTEELIFVKNGLVIDIYSKRKNTGYIFNNAKEEHLYKFCIIKTNRFYVDNNCVPLFYNPSDLSTMYSNSNAKKIKNETIENSVIVSSEPVIVNVSGNSNKVSPRNVKVKNGILHHQMLLELKDKLEKRTNPNKIFKQD
jgi:hypothetical protein